jgi:hypothetical protein
LQAALAAAAGATGASPERRRRSSGVMGGTGAGAGGLSRCASWAHNTADASGVTGGGGYDGGGYSGAAYQGLHPDAYDCQHDNEEYDGAELEEALGVSWSK